MNQIKTLDITNFRHLNNLNGIKIGERLTVIAGVNGTGKSSLLGLIGHIFSFHDKHGVILKTIDNKPFETKFSEVFRFSSKHDYQVPYNYGLTFSDGTRKLAVSRYIAKEQRFRIDVGSRQRASGKVRLPVVYLGLRRLIPLAQESDKSIKTIQDNKLTEEDKGLYQEWHNRVLVINDKVVPQHTKSWNKELYYAVCDTYDAFGNSAGQDNLAQIILALLSFRKLKDEMKTEYPGGLLLIDEIETTLYPAAQQQLMDLLLKAAADYDLQVVFTSHSIEIIDYMLNPEAKPFYYSSEIVYLHNPKGAIEVIQDKTQIEGITANLRAMVKPKSKKLKINVYLEDEEARAFFKGIITQEIRAELEIKQFNYGADSYQSLLKERFPEFKGSLIILDGDKSNGANPTKSKNLLFLPGTVRPENVLLDYLDKLSTDDDFWESHTGGYNKQVFLKNKPTSTANRIAMKSWFNAEKKNWGSGGRKLFNRWKKDNPALLERFNVELTKRIKLVKAK